jgi:hypothetical protein
MIRLVLLKIREVLGGAREGLSGAAEARGPRAMDLAALPISIRLDTALWTKGQGSMGISRLIWLSPESEGAPERRLEAMLYPN